MKIVRYVGKGKNLPEEYRKAIQPGSRTAVINTLKPGGNVTLRAKLDGKAVAFENDSLTRDFLDLATLIYIVDELELRKHSKDHWSRKFEVIAPVKSPKLWEKHEELLRRVLKTLAGDDYNFAWMNRPKLDALGRHRQQLPEGFDSVCLFSGGMDSFLGAKQLLAEGKKLLLVGHQADGTAASAQTALFKFLKEKYPGACHLIQFRVSRSGAKSQDFKLPNKCEETHRPRSLIFLGLAISIANTLGIGTIYIPENGLIALNAPLQKSRLGTLSTRTAHPRYLGELCDFLNASGVFKGEIRNPFLFVSKTDMLANAKDLATPLRRSVSCARPSRYKNLGVSHCGYCVPCIYRRIAMLTTGLDNKQDYAFSVFDDLEQLDVTKQLDFRALVRWAERVVGSSPLERQMLVLSHGSFPVSAGERFGPEAVTSYAIWGEMLLRWSKDFLKKVDSVASPSIVNSLGRNGSRRRKRS